MDLGFLRQLYLAPEPGYVSAYLNTSPTEATLARSHCAGEPPGKRSPAPVRTSRRLTW